MRHMLMTIVLVVGSAPIGAAEPPDPPPTYPAVTPQELERYLAVPKYTRPLWVRTLTERSGCLYPGWSRDDNVCWNWL